MSVAARSMGAGLRAIRGIAGLEVVDRLGIRRPLERALYQGSRNGARAAGAASRTFAAATKLGRPKRLPAAPRGDLFDLTPTDEQQMLRDAFRDFARDELRPVAVEADAECAAPPELIRHAAGLGLTTLGVPEELGGVVSERSAVTAVIVAEALAHGDMGLAAAVLAPAAVATALAEWGDAEQQSKYLPAFVGEDVPAAALAIQEPSPVFDPFALQTRFADGALTGAKALVPLAASAELFVVAAQGPDGAALFLVESGADGVFVEPDPAMGLRAAATGRLVLECAAAQPLGGAADYAECVRRARLAWCALAVGTAQAMLDYVIPYVNERIAFGEPIANRQAVAFAVSDIAIEVEGMRLATYRAAARADQGRSHDREVALARHLCAQKGMEIGSSGLGLLGGHGYVKDHPVERWYRDLRAVGVMEGALLV